MDYEEMTWGISVNSEVPVAPTNFHSSASAGKTPLK